MRWRDCFFLFCKFIRVILFFNALSVVLVVQPNNEMIIAELIIRRDYHYLSIVKKDLQSLRVRIPMNTLNISVTFTIEFQYIISRWN